MGELNNSGRDWYHESVYTNSSALEKGRWETVLFNGGDLAIRMNHVDECKGWHRDNTCTCPIDDQDESE